MESGGWGDAEELSLSGAELLFSTALGTPYTTPPFN